MSSSGVDKQKLQTVTQHIESETYPYRLPVFKVEPKNINFSNDIEKNAHTIRIVSCDFNTNYYNISFNNNVLRWLRKVKLDLNEMVIEKFPDNINPVNPYFSSNSPPEEWHLCQLYISPNQYESINDLMYEINYRISESFKSLFEFDNQVVRSYENVSLNYEYNIFNPSGVIKFTDAQISGSTISGETMDKEVSYIVDGEMAYTSTKDNLTKFVSNAVLRMKGTTNAILTGATLLNPKFEMERFKEYEIEGQWFVYQSNLNAISHSGNINILREFNLLKNTCNSSIYTNIDGLIHNGNVWDDEEQTIIDIWDRSFPLGSKTQKSNRWNPVRIDDDMIIVNKVHLKSFPDYIGLSTDSKRTTFSNTDYIYTPENNRDLCFGLDLHFNITERGEGVNEIFGTLDSGNIRVFSINANVADTVNRKNVSIIDYSGDILYDTELVPVTKLYYDDNFRFSDKYPFYNLTYNVPQGNNLYVIDSFIDTPSSLGISTVKHSIRTSTTNKYIDMYFELKDEDLFTDTEQSTYRDIDYSYIVNSGNVTEFMLNPDYKINDPKIIGYKISKLINPNYENEDEEININFVANSSFVDNITTPVISFDNTLPITQQINKIISNNQKNLIIILTGNLIKCDGYGFNTRGFNKDGEKGTDGIDDIYYSDGKIDLEYYYTEFSINSYTDTFVIRDADTNEVITPFNSSTSNMYVYTGDGIYETVIVNENGEVIHETNRRYNLLFNDMLMVARMVTVEVSNENSNMLTITNLILSIDGSIQCDKYGNIVKLYYRKDDQYLPIKPDEESIIPEDNRYYEDQTREPKYTKFPIADNSDKYINMLIYDKDGNNLVETTTDIKLSNITRNKVNYLYSDYNEVRQVFTPLNSLDFEYSDVYYTNINNMLYLPYGTYRKIGELNYKLNNDSSTQGRTMEETYLFNDIVDRNIDITLYKNKIHQQTITVGPTEVKDIIWNLTKDIVPTIDAYYVKDSETDNLIQIKSIKEIGDNTKQIDVNFEDIFNELTVQRYYIDNINYNKVTNPDPNVGYYYNVGTIDFPTYVYVTPTNRYTQNTEAVLSSNGNYLAMKRNGDYYAIQKYVNNNIEFVTLDVLSSQVNPSEFGGDIDIPNDGTTVYREFNKFNNWRKYNQFELIGDSNIINNRTYIYVGNDNKFDKTVEDNYKLITSENRYTLKVDMISEKEEENNIGNKIAKLNNVCVQLFNANTMNVVSVSSDSLVLSKYGNNYRYNNINVDVRTVLGNVNNNLQFSDNPITLVKNTSFYAYEEQLIVVKDLINNIINIQNQTATIKYISDHYEYNDSEVKLFVLTFTVDNSSDDKISVVTRNDSTEFNIEKDVILTQVNNVYEFIAYPLVKYELNNFDTFIYGGSYINFFDAYSETQLYIKSSVTSAITFMKVSGTINHYRTTDDPNGFGNQSYIIKYDGSNDPITVNVLIVFKENKYINSKTSDKYNQIVNYKSDNGEPSNENVYYYGTIDNGYYKFDRTFSLQRNMTINDLPDVIINKDQTNIWILDTNDDNISSTFIPHFEISEGIYNSKYLILLHENNQFKYGDQIVTVELGEEFNEKYLILEKNGNNWVFNNKNVIIKGVDTVTPSLFSNTLSVDDDTNNQVLNMKVTTGNVEIINVSLMNLNVDQLRNVSEKILLDTSSNLANEVISGENEINPNRLSLYKEYNNESKYFVRNSDEKYISNFIEHGSTINDPSKHYEYESNYFYYDNGEHIEYTKTPLLYYKSKTPNVAGSSMTDIWIPIKSAYIDIDKVIPIYTLQLNELTENGNNNNRNIYVKSDTVTTIRNILENYRGHESQFFIKLNNETNSEKIDYVQIPDNVNLYGDRINATHYGLNSNEIFEISDDMDISKARYFYGKDGNAILRCDLIVIDDKYYPIRFNSSVIKVINGVTSIISANFDSTIDFEENAKYYSIAGNNIYETIYFNPLNASHKLCTFDRIKKDIKGAIPNDETLFIKISDIYLNNTEENLFAMNLSSLKNSNDFYMFPSMVKNKDNNLVILNNSMSFTKDNIIRRITITNNDASKDNNGSPCFVGIDQQQISSTWIYGYKRVSFDQENPTRLDSEGYSTFTCVKYPSTNSRYYKVLKNDLISPNSYFPIVNNNEKYTINKEKTYYKIKEDTSIILSRSDFNLNKYGNVSSQKEVSMMCRNSPTITLVNSEENSLLTVNYDVIVPVDIGGIESKSITLTADNFDEDVFTILDSGIEATIDIENAPLMISSNGTAEEIKETFYMDRDIVTGIKFLSSNDIIVIINDNKEFVSYGLLTNDSNILSYIITSKYASYVDKGLNNKYVSNNSLLTFISNDGSEFNKFTEDNITLNVTSRGFRIIDSQTINHYYVKKLYLINDEDSSETEVTPSSEVIKLKPGSGNNIFINNDDQTKKYRVESDLPISGTFSITGANNYSYNSYHFNTSIENKFYSIMNIKSTTDGFKYNNKLISVLEQNKSSVPQTITIKCEESYEETEEGEQLKSYIYTYNSKGVNIIPNPNITTEGNYIFTYNKGSLNQFTYNNIQYTIIYTTDSSSITEFDSLTLEIYHSTKVNDGFIVINAKTKERFDNATISPKQASTSPSLQSLINKELTATLSNTSFTYSNDLWIVTIPKGTSTERSIKFVIIPNPEYNKFVFGLLNTSSIRTVQVIQDEIEILPLINTSTEKYAILDGEINSNVVYTYNYSVINDANNTTMTITNNKKTPIVLSIDMLYNNFHKLSLTRSDNDSISCSKYKNTITNTIQKYRVSCMISHKETFLINTDDDKLSEVQEILTDGGMIVQPPNNTIPSDAEITILPNEFYNNNDTLISYNDTDKLLKCDANGDEVMKWFVDHLNNLWICDIEPTLSSDGNTLLNYVPQKVEYLLDMDKVNGFIDNTKVIVKNIFTNEVLDKSDFNIENFVNYTFTPADISETLVFQILNNEFMFDNKIISIYDASTNSKITPPKDVGSCTFTPNYDGTYLYTSTPTSTPTIRVYIKHENTNIQLAYMFTSNNNKKYLVSIITINNRLILSLDISKLTFTTKDILMISKDIYTNTDTFGYNIQYPSKDYNLYGNNNIYVNNSIFGEDVNIIDTIYAKSFTTDKYVSTENDVTNYQIPYFKNPPNESDNESETYSLLYDENSLSFDKVISYDKLTDCANAVIYMNSSNEEVIIPFRDNSYYVDTTNNVTISSEKHIYKLKRYDDAIDLEEVTVTSGTFTPTNKYVSMLNIKMKYIPYSDSSVFYNASSKKWTLDQIYPIKNFYMMNGDTLKPSVPYSNTEIILTFDDTLHAFRGSRALSSLDPNIENKNIILDVDFNLSSQQSNLNSIIVDYDNNLHLFQYNKEYLKPIDNNSKFIDIFANSERMNHKVALIPNNNGSKFTILLSNDITENQEVPSHSDFIIYSSGTEFILNITESVKRELFYKKSKFIYNEFYEQDNTVHSSINPYDNIFCKSDKKYSWFSTFSKPNQNEQVNYYRISNSKRNYIRNAYFINNIYSRNTTSNENVFTIYNTVSDTLNAKLINKTEKIYKIGNLEVKIKNSKGSYINSNEVYINYINGNHVVNNDIVTIYDKYNDNMPSQLYKLSTVPWYSRYLTYEQASDGKFYKVPYVRSLNFSLPVDGHICNEFGKLYEYEEFPESMPIGYEYLIYKYSELNPEHERNFINTMPNGYTSFENEYLIIPYSGSITQDLIISYIYPDYKYINPTEFYRENSEHINNINGNYVLHNYEYLLIHNNAYQLTGKYGFIEDDSTDDIYIKHVSRNMFIHVDKDIATPQNPIYLFGWYNYSKTYTQTVDGIYIKVDSSINADGYVIRPTDPDLGPLVRVPEYIPFDPKTNPENEPFAKFIYINDGTNEVSVIKQNSDGSYSEPILMTGTAGYYNNLIYYKEIKIREVYNYIDVPGKYIATLSVTGTSSVTNKNYSFQVNTLIACDKDIDLIFESDNELKLIPKETDVKYILNAVSIKEMLMFRPDGLPSNYELSTTTSAGSTASMKILKYVSQDEVDNPDILSFLAKCNLSDQYIYYNNKFIKCIQLMKEGFYTNPNDNTRIFSNLGNTLTSTELYFDFNNSTTMYGPSSNEMVVFDFNTINKDSPYKKLYPNIEYERNDINEIYYYNIFSGSNTGTTRSYIYCPPSNDFDDNVCKNVEYIDQTLANPKAYVHSYTASNNNSIKEVVGMNDVAKNLATSLEFRYNKSSCNDFKEKCMYLHSIKNAKQIPTYSDKNTYIPLNDPLFTFPGNEFTDTIENQIKLNYNIFAEIKFARKSEPSTETTDNIEYSVITYTYSKENSDPNTPPVDKKNNNIISFTCGLYSKVLNQIFVESDVKTFILTTYTSDTNNYFKIEIIHTNNRKYVRLMNGRMLIYDNTDISSEGTSNFGVYIYNTVGIKQDSNTDYHDIRNEIPLTYYYPFSEPFYTMNSDQISDEAGFIGRTTYIMKTSDVLSEFGIGENKIVSGRPFCRIDVKYIVFNNKSNNVCNIKVENGDFNIVQTYDKALITIDAISSMFNFTIIPLSNNSDKSIINIDVNRNDLYYDDKLTIKFINGHYISYNGRVIDIFNNSEDQSLFINYNLNNISYTEKGDIDKIYRKGYKRDNETGRYILNNGQYVYGTSSNYYVGGYPNGRNDLVLSPLSFFIPNESDTSFSNIINNSDNKKYNKRYVKTIEYKSFMSNTNSEVNDYNINPNGFNKNDYSFVLVPIDNKIPNNGYDTFLLGNNISSNKLKNNACNIDFLNESKSIKEHEITSKILLKSTYRRELTLTKVPTSISSSDTMWNISQQEGFINTLLFKKFRDDVEPFVNPDIIKNEDFTVYYNPLYELVNNDGDIFDSIDLIETGNSTYIMNTDLIPELADKKYIPKMKHIKATNIGKYTCMGNEYIFITNSNNKIPYDSSKIKARILRSGGVTMKQIVLSPNNIILYNGQVDNNGNYSRVGNLNNLVDKIIPPSSYGGRVSIESSEIDIINANYFLITYTNDYSTVLPDKEVVKINVPIESFSFDRIDRYMFKDKYNENVFITGITYPCDYNGNLPKCDIDIKFNIMNCYWTFNNDDKAKRYQIYEVNDPTGNPYIISKFDDMINANSFNLLITEDGKFINNDKEYKIKLISTNEYITPSDIASSSVYVTLKYTHAPYIIYQIYIEYFDNDEDRKYGLNKFVHLNCTNEFNITLNLDNRNNPTLNSLNVDTVNKNINYATMYDINTLETLNVGNEVSTILSSPYQIKYNGVINGEDPSKTFNFSSLIITEIPNDLFEYYNDMITGIIDKINTDSGSSGGNDNIFTKSVNYYLTNLLNKYGYSNDMFEIETIDSSKDINDSKIYYFCKYNGNSNSIASSIYIFNEKPYYLIPIMKYNIPKNDRIYINEYTRELTFTDINDNIINVGYTPTYDDKLVPDNNLHKVGISDITINNDGTITLIIDSNRYNYNIDDVKVIPADIWSGSGSNLSLPLFTYHQIYYINNGPKNISSVVNKIDSNLTYKEYNNIYYGKNGNNEYIVRVSTPDGSEVTQDIITNHNDGSYIIEKIYTNDPSSKPRYPTELVRQTGKIALDNSLITLTNKVTRRIMSFSFWEVLLADQYGETESLKSGKYIRLTSEDLDAKRITIQYANNELVNIPNLDLYIKLYDNLYIINSSESYRKIDGFFIYMYSKNQNGDYYLFERNLRMKSYPISLKYNGDDVNIDDIMGTLKDIDNIIVKFKSDSRKWYLDETSTTYPDGFEIYNSLTDEQMLGSVDDETDTIVVQGSNEYLIFDNCKFTLEIHKFNYLLPSLSSSLYFTLTLRPTVISGMNDALNEDFKYFITEYPFSTLTSSGAQYELSSYKCVSFIGSLTTLSKSGYGKGLKRVNISKLKYSYQRYENSIEGKSVNDVRINKTSSISSSGQILSYYRNYRGSNYVLLSSIDDMKITKNKIGNVPIFSENIDKLNLGKGYRLRNVVLDYITRNNIGNYSNQIVDRNMYGNITDPNTITSIIEVYDGDAPIGIGFNALYSYLFDDYYSKSSIETNAYVESINNIDYSNVWYNSDELGIVNNLVKLNTNNLYNTVNTNEYIYNLDIDGYYHLQNYYTTYGLREYASANVFPTPQFNLYNDLLENTLTAHRFVYSVYEKVIDNRKDIYSPNLTCISRTLYDDNFIFGLENLRCKFATIKHNPSIFPETVKTDVMQNVSETNPLWVDKGFRIAASPDSKRELPNVYGLNIFNYENGKYDFNRLTFVHDGRTFTIIITKLDGKTVNSPVFYTFMDSLCASSGQITDGLIGVECGKSMNDLIDDKGATESTIIRSNPNSNFELLYDTYFNTIRNVFVEGKDIVNLVEMYGEPTLGLSFGFDCIPVTSNPIKSITQNFLEVLKSPNFAMDNTTIKMSNIIEYNKGSFKITKDSYKLNEYDKNTEYIDDYYYNFTIDDDIWKRLGFVPCKIEVNKDTFMSYDENESIDVPIDNSQINPVYLIKGKYYSEQLYTGPINTPHAYKFVMNKTIDIGDSKKIIQTKYEIKSNEDIKNIDKDVMSTYFMKTQHYAERMMNLSIPTNIEVKITQNEDVEKLVNDTDRFNDNASSLGTFNVVRPNDPAYNNIQQTIDVNATISLPNDSNMYVFLTSPNQRYPIINSESMLNIEYIK